jgi:hypothetical protein
MFKSRLGQNFSGKSGIESSHINGLVCDMSRLCCV